MVIKSGSFENLILPNHKVSPSFPSVLLHTPFILLCWDVGIVSYSLLPTLSQTQHGISFSFYFNSQRSYFQVLKIYPEFSQGRCFNGAS
jgi:hypothetical protein